MTGSRFLKLFFFSVLVLCFFLPTEGNTTSPAEIVVKIQTVRNSPNFQQPWQHVGQLTTHGTGFIIDGNMILTNAHVVSDSVFIHVRRAGRTEKYSAEVKYFDHESDLALLEVAEKKFFKGVSTLKIGDLPDVRDKVAVYGFPDGGDKLSITEGVVSRIEHINYAYSGSFLLSCQIDASINAGNSGGPVIFNGKIAGVAFQGMHSGYDNIGYMIPAPVIQQFLKDTEDGSIEGIPDLGISMQKLESPYLRNYYKLEDGENGALINNISPGSPSRMLLKKEDVILSVENEDVAYDGTIEFRKGQRTFFGYIIQGKQIGETITLGLKRDGKKISIEVPLQRSVGFDRLVPYKHEVLPRYYIFGGVVFQPLTLNYLMEYGSVADWYQSAPVELMDYYLNGDLEFQTQEIVILSQVLADKVNIGYHELADNVIKTVNGVAVRNFAHLVTLLENSREKYLIIMDTQGTKIVFDKEKMLKGTNNIIRKYMIKSAKHFWSP
ncbi:S1C family serine protease [Desulfomarina profundi]|nr:serine protease [Desulfomarina profundi]